MKKYFVYDGVADHPLYMDGFRALSVGYIKGAKLMLSNSNPKNVSTEDDFFVDLYDGFNLNEVLANRNINSKGNGRKPISELLITNY